MRLLVTEVMAAAGVVVLLGYAVAIAVGFLVYRLVFHGIERRFIETADREPAAYWVALQWISTFPTNRP